MWLGVRECLLVVAVVIMVVALLNVVMIAFLARQVFLMRRQIHTVPKVSHGRPRIEGFFRDPPKSHGEDAAPVVPAVPIPVTCREDVAPAEDGASIGGL